MYRPPRLNNSDRAIRPFLHEFGKLMNNLSKVSHASAVAGDFNIDLLKVNERSSYSDFMDMMVGFSFFPRITLPTRFSKRNCSLIDQIYVKNPKIDISKESLILFSALSDHLGCITSLCSRYNNNLSDRYIKYRQVNAESIAAFCNDMNTINFTAICDNDLSCDPNINYDIIHNTIHDRIEKHMPLKTVKYNKYKHKKSGWITEGILISIKYRDKLYRKVKSSSSSPQHDQLSQNLKTYNNILKKTIRQAKYDYYSYRFTEFKNDMKRSWDTLKTLLNRQSKDNFPAAFNYKNKKITDANIIAEKFNEYFSNIGNDIPMHPNAKNERNIYLKAVNTISFKFNLVNEDDIKKIFNNIQAKNSTGQDELSTKL